MMNADIIKQNLSYQGLPVKEDDIPFIQQTLKALNEAKAVLPHFPDLNMEVPITIVDKEEMK